MGTIIENDMDIVSRGLVGYNSHTSHVHDTGAIAIETPDAAILFCQSNAIDITEARKNKQARCLYQAYHFDKNVKEKGHEVTQFQIHERYREEWTECVDNIREQLLSKVERKHISIECNPTSNILIGEVSGYEDHPIVKFFNHGLKTSYPSHNICVSINTDDKGVMSTSLEREYSMMALSLEKSIKRENENSPRNILDWLNQVRKMSQEQLFNKKVIG